MARPLKMLTAPRKLVVIAVVSLHAGLIPAILLGGSREQETQFVVGPFGIVSVLDHHGLLDAHRTAPRLGANRTAPGHARPVSGYLLGEALARPRLRGLGRLFLLADALLGRLAELERLALPAAAVADDLFVEYRPHFLELPRPPPQRRHEPAYRGRPGRPAGSPKEGRAHCRT